MDGYERSQDVCTYSLFIDRSRENVTKSKFPRKIKKRYKTSMIY